MIMHKHHILPKHAGGSDDPSNIIRVNIAMHSFLHNLRFEETGDEFDRIAAQGLSGQIGSDSLLRLVHQENGKRQGSRMDMSYVRSHIDIEKVRESLRTRVPSLNKKRSLRWSVTSPEGTTMVIKNMAEFCREHSLSKSTMTKVAKGKRPQHKGWRCSYADTSI